MSISWQNIKGHLERWYQDPDQKNEAIFTFLRSELMRIYPINESIEKKEDIVQQVLHQIIEKPLKLSEIQNLRAYLYKTLKTKSLNAQRKNKREVPWKENYDETIQSEEVSELPEKRVERQERIEEVSQILENLRVEDAIVIKLSTAPSILTKEEKNWLVQRNKRSLEQINEILSREKHEELVGLFYPDFRGKEESKERRKYLETFRVRRNRALKKAQELRRNM